MISDRAKSQQGSIDWSPLAALVATDHFVRVGAYMEVMNWTEYTNFLSEWAGVTRFESTILRIMEAGNRVTMQIEERHYKDEEFIRKNVLSIFEFDDRHMIVRLDIYEQAKDSGQWIIDAATRRG